ncbi:flavin-containing monooxygenase 5-like [Littorina saxatilis]|uniref:Flavin-containing monooxygenase n=1 Tax=Littorina saxatilis TaxID=31220 RepID=A0AAN9BHE5_9CAEN
MAAVRRVAVIGAGASGLPSTKTCVEEGLDTVCLERADEVGGLWRFTKKVVEGRSCVMKSTVMNTSKEMSCFSDFPPPKDFPNFMQHEVAQKYFRAYADHFDLDRHIRYNTEVTKVRQADDYVRTGRWVVESIDHKSGKKSTDTFDAVLVCSGHHAEKNLPEVPGISEFEGPVIHSHDYRPDTEHDDKKILVVGLGNSAGDLAVELSRKGKQVFLSTRKGTWIFHCCMFRGMPWDLCLMTRFEFWKNSCLPFSWIEAKMAATLNQTIDHDLYGLTPACMPFSHSPFVNDELGGRIICGAVKVKDDLQRLTTSGVEFKDGSFEDIDVVLMATGYTIGFPFMEKEVVDIEKNQLKFYKQMFQPDLQHQTLAFIGCVQPSGCIWPICELQARLAVSVFKGAVKLPPRDDMWKEIEANESMRSSRYPNTIRHTLEIDWLPTMDELAEMIGCKPNIGRLVLTDPKLALRVLFGPCLPYQYRLEGPGRWSGARDAVLSFMDRVRFPLQSRALPPNRRSGLVKTAEWVLFPSFSWVVFLELLVLALLLLVLCRG